MYRQCQVSSQKGAVRVGGTLVFYVFVGFGILNSDTTFQGCVPAL